MIDKDLRFIKRSIKRFPWHIYDHNQSPTPLGGLTPPTLYMKSLCGQLQIRLSDLEPTSRYMELAEEEPEEVMICRNCLKRK